ncbi:MAG: hypothetical protein KIT31_34900 [Deltaproteobacteria bacterium]|nr:hypothetical protein [Deltaproteobacteria bacterium]
MRVRKVWVVAAVAIVAVCGMPKRAEAWNPVKAVTDKIVAAGRAIGGVLGAPVGGFVEAATTPVIRNVEHAGHRLIGDLDLAIGNNIDRAQGAAGKVLDQVNTIAGAQLDKVNSTLQARILQIQSGVDATVDRVFDRLDRVIGRLDDTAQRLLARAEAAGKRLVEQLDKSVADALSKADRILAARLLDLGVIVTSSIRDVDAIAQARLDQLDDLAARRVENLDVIATKQSLNLEGMLLRIATLAGLVGLIAFVAWRAFREVADALANAVGPKAVSAKVAARFVPQLLLAAGGALLLWYLSDALPKDSVRRAAAQVAQQRSAFDAAVDALDVVAARYHASQLEILEPEHAAAHRRRLSRLVLLHSVFTRPGQLRTIEGLTELVTRVTALEAALPNDPEIAIAKGHILWQVAGTRDEQYEAATLCAAGLEHAPSSWLAPLARNYIVRFLDDPYEPPAGGMTVARLAAIAGEPPPASAQFAAVIEFDEAVSKLDRASTAAYLEMLDAQAELEVERAKTKNQDAAAIAAARAARNDAAKRLIAAWAAFDHRLETSPAFSSDAIVLSAFTLDDSILSHARFYAELPATNDRPPMLTAEPPVLAPVMRVKIAPLRLAWEQRYAPLLGARERQIVAYEEAVRFKVFELRANGFEQSYLDFAVALRAGGPEPRLRTAAGTAAVHAARMGLYRERAGHRESLAAEINGRLASKADPLAAEVLADVAAAYRIPRLRFL